jgi:hypothetical protein
VVDIPLPMLIEFLLVANGKALCSICGTTFGGIAIELFGFDF